MVAWAGERSRRDAAPDRGYPFSVSERTDYDPVHARFIDTWQREGDERTWTQSQRCYSPADLLLLIEPTGLELAGMEVDGRRIDPAGDADSAHPLWNRHEYRVALTARDPAP